MDQRLLSDAAAHLNRAHAEFKNASSDREVALEGAMLLSCMYLYDLQLNISLLAHAPKSGFAGRVAMRGLVLHVFEFDRAMSTHLTRRFLVAATMRGIEVDRTELRRIRGRWKAELEKIRRWEGVRNLSAAHYDQDVKQTVDALDALDPAHVVRIAKAAHEYQRTLWDHIRDSGVGRWSQG